MKTTDIYVPSAALILYSVKDHSNYSNKLSDDEAYFEIAPILNGKMGAAIPLSHKAASVLAKVLSKTSKDTIGGVIPEKLIYTNTSTGQVSLTWYTPPQRRKLRFHKEYEIPTGYVNLPWLIWSIHYNQLRLWACMEKPQMTTKLYKAPFHNTSEKGVVCLGTGWQQLEQEFKTFNSSITAAESAFFTTIFTHMQDGKIVHGNLNSIYKEIVGTDKPFPVKALVDTKTTLGNILKHNKDDQIK